MFFNQLVFSVKKNDAHKLGMFSMLGTIARTEGLFGLYRGLGPNIMKVWFLKQ